MVPKNRTIEEGSNFFSLRYTPLVKFAKKSLGQNFLTDPEIRDGILEAAGDIKGKNILEIGPGLGFLTSKLLSSGANLTAVELDDRAVVRLQNDFGHMDHFRLIPGDILDQDLDVMFEQKNYSIIANIPYNITAPILRKTLSSTKNKPDFMLLMVQKEVAQKLVAKKRSILSISVEIFAEAEICFLVGRECFNPVPGVDSAIIKITTRKEPLVSAEDEKKFFQVVNRAFKEKRKKLSNTLPAEWLEGIDANLRPEVLDIDDWLKITKNAA